MQKLGVHGCWREAKEAPARGARTQSIVAWAECPMPNRLTEEWSACQRRATELERHYAAQMVRYWRGEAPPPDEAMKVQLQAIRKEATTLLSAAMSEVDERVRKADAALRFQAAHRKI